MCQVFDPTHPASGISAIAWPDDPHGRYAGALIRDGRELHFALTLEVRADGLSAALDVPPLGIVGAPFAVAAYEPPTLVLGMPGASGDLDAWSGVVDGDRIAGQWQGGGIAASFEMIRCPIEPSPFTVQDVAYQGVGGRLAGSLVRPLGVGPHPAALHLPGADAMTRDQSRFLAQFLARHGVASLILDAPGAGRSTGTMHGYGLDEQARDAVAGVRLLRDAEGIDRSRIGLIAGGLAGWAAPVAACLLGDLAFLVLRSAPAISPAEQARHEADARLAAAGYGRAERACIEDPDRPHDGAVSALRRRDLDFQPLPLLAALDLPILALYGERDERLPALSCAEALVDLRRRRARDVTVHVFADAGHGLIQSPSPSAPFDWPRLPAGYLPALAAWMQTRVLRPSGAA